MAVRQLQVWVRTVSSLKSSGRSERPRQDSGGRQNLGGTLLNRDRASRTVDSFADRTSEKPLADSLRRWRGDSGGSGTESGEHPDGVRRLIPATAGHARSANHGCGENEKLGGMPDSTQRNLQAAAAISLDMARGEAISSQQLKHFYCSMNLPADALPVPVAPSALDGFAQPRSTAIMLRRSRM
jgi:hypothetical protein